MTRRFPYVSGAWLAICDRCQRQFYNFELRRDGEKPGLMVCADCYDPRHPLHDIGPVPTVRSVPWARPQKPEVVRFTDSDDYENCVRPTDYPKSW